MSPSYVPEVNLSEFATLIGLEQLGTGRYIVLLVANLLGGALSGVQNPHLSRASGISTTCKRGSFVRETRGKNLNQCGMPVFEKKIQEAKDAGELVIADAQVRLKERNRVAALARYDTCDRGQSNALRIQKYSNRLLTNREKQCR